MHKPKEIITNFTDWLLSERPDNEHCYLDPVEVEILQESKENNSSEKIKNIPNKKTNSIAHNSQLNERDRAKNLAAWILRRKK